MKLVVAVIHERDQKRTSDALLRAGGDCLSNGRHPVSFSVPTMRA